MSVIPHFIQHASPHACTHTHKQRHQVLVWDDVRQQSRIIKLLLLTQAMYTESVSFLAASAGSDTDPSAAEQYAVLSAASQEQLQA